MAVREMNRRVDLPWQSTDKRSLETVRSRDIAGLFEMAVCCAKPPYVTIQRVSEEKAAEAEQSPLRTEMDKLKIDNFSKTHCEIDFPKYISLDSDSAKKIQSLIAEKLKLEDCSDGLSLVRKIDALGKLCKGIDAEDEKFSFSNAISLSGLRNPEHVYVNWYRYDDIDKLNFDDFDKYFDDLWYPGVDDIDIFDDSLTWILSVSHSGQIKVLRL
jgi:hypothetical protein